MKPLLSRGVGLTERLWLYRVRRRLDRVGEGVGWDGVPRVQNAGRIFLGRRVLVSSLPVRTHLVTGRGGVLTLGDDVRISHGVGLTAFREIRVGDGTEMGAFTMVLDTDFHDVVDRDRTPEPRAIRIGRRVRLGPHVTVLPGSVIEDDAQVLAHSVVSGTVPAGQVVSGVPAQPLRVQQGTGSQSHGSKVSDPSQDLAAAVGAVVAATFNLKALPSPETSRDEVSGWDSLGSLKLLLALEDAFTVSLSGSAVAEATNVAAITSLLRQTLHREA